MDLDQPRLLLQQADDALLVLALPDLANGGYDGGRLLHPHSPNGRGSRMYFMDQDTAMRNRPRTLGGSARKAWCPPPPVRNWLTRLRQQPGSGDQRAEHAG
jgi:hypothetical protein